MADFGSPVVNAGTAVNPLQTLSQVIGIKQQQQQLETGRFIQQQAQAKAYQDAQSAAERQALAKVDWKPFFDNEDIEGAQKTAIAVAPTTGAEFGTRLGETMNNAIGVKKAMAGLNQSYLEPYRNALALWGNDPNSNIADLAHQLDAVKKSVPKSAQDKVSAIVNGSLKALGMPDLLTGEPKATPQQKQAALAFSRAGLAPSETASLTTPAVGTVVGNENALVGTTQNKLTGAINQSPGEVGLGLTPTQQPGYLAQAGAATGGAGVDVQRFSGITNAAASAQTGVALADQVAALADQVRTGELSKEWADKLTVLKQKDPSITARQMLAKYAAQLKTTATQGAATDSERAQIDAGMPSPETMNPAAVRDAAQYLHGYFRMNQARGLNAMQHISKTGSPVGLTQADTAYMQSQDPFVHAFRDMTREQQKQFLINRYGAGGSKDPQGFAEFEKRIKGQ